MSIILSVMGEYREQGFLYTPEEDTLIKELMQSGLRGRGLEVEFRKAGFEPRSWHALQSRFGRITIKPSVAKSLSLRSFKDPNLVPDKFDLELAREIRSLLNGNRT